MLVIGTKGLFFNIAGTSIYKYVEAFQRSETRVGIRAVADKLQSALNSKYVFGYTEKHQPIVRIYYYAHPPPPQKKKKKKKRKKKKERKKSALKMMKFEGEQQWMKENVQTTRPEVKPKCTNLTKLILWYDVLG